MGCCISKCRPKKDFQQEVNKVQDKLVISQTPIPKSPIPPPFKKPLSPSPSPTTSTSSFSSFSCTNNSSISSSTLTSCSSCSSSVSCSQDKSFSNEFLRSCAKENPQIVKKEQIKGNLENPVKKRVEIFDAQAKPNFTPVKQLMPQRVVNKSTPQKRARPISPTLTRQKSFRKEPERPSKALRSPSPSRRFDKDIYKSCVSSKGNVARKENIRPPSPNRNLSRCGEYTRNRETHTHQIGSKIDEIGIGEMVSRELMDSIPMEDIDNPLIALDCFIFL